jgi:hypothetical protein
MVERVGDVGMFLNNGARAQAGRSRAAPPDATGRALAQALRTARDKLLDRSLRNRLINTNLESDRARQLRLVEACSDEVFGLLHKGRSLSFAPAAAPPAPAQEAPPGPWGGDAADDDPDPEEEGSRPPISVLQRRTLSRVRTRLGAEALRKRLLGLHYEAQTLEEEQGVNVLYLALGFLEWREAKAPETPRYAPLVLLPVDLVRDGARDRLTLELRAEDLFANISLGAWLRDELGVSLPDLPEDEDWAPSRYFGEVRQAIGDRPGWSVRPDEIVLGFFSFSKFLLWRDLDPETWPDPSRLTKQPLLQQILLRDAQEAVPADDPDSSADAAVPDGIPCIDQTFPPAALVHVTDADSSQAIAVQEAVEGRSLVIQGPPGTGKSQTITNIIAGAAARGKSVLFIAEKMAALDVVHRRLAERGLGPLCLELHSRKATKTQVIEQLRQAREAPSPPTEPSSGLSELEQTQSALRHHSERMHASVGGGPTPYELIGRISRLMAKGAPAPRFAVSAAASWSAAELEAASRQAAQLGARLAEAGIPAAHPWRGMGGPPPGPLEQERLEAPITRLAAAAAGLAPAVEAAARALTVPGEPSLAEGRRLCAALALAARRPAAAGALLEDERVGALAGELAALAADGERLGPLRQSLAERMIPEALEEDWAPVRRTIAGHGQSWLRWLSGPYREAAARLKGAVAGEAPRTLPARLELLDRLLDLRRTASRIAQAGTSMAPALGAHWQGEASDWPRLGEAAAWVLEARGLEPLVRLTAPGQALEPAAAARLGQDLAAALDEAEAALDVLAGALALDPAAAFDGRERDDLTARELAALAARWGSGLARIGQWPPLREGLAWLARIGAGGLAEQLFRGEIGAPQCEPVLSLAACEALWAKARERDPGLEQIHGDELDAAVRRFARADRARIRQTAAEVARAHAAGRPAGVAGAAGVLADEMKKSRNLMPVRRLMEAAGPAVQRFKPVFMMSPLSAAQFLAPGRLEFDLLVIDEASQVRPEDALGAIARCRQIVVVGDDRQLPPTSFFSRMVGEDDSSEHDDDEEAASDEPGLRQAAVRDIESILNLCARFPQRMLSWHYRSQHPALIATSNRSFYGGRLMLPPSTSARAFDGESGLRFHKVAEGGYERGRTARNLLEAQAVAEAALAHARERPGLSLGVGTFSVAQRDAVREKLETLARQHPELDAFMRARSGGESLFVKNLENIQGDERDVILISVGYGRDRDGRLTQNFGPVGRDGGERRLNVLITRARRRCEVFSSLEPDDIRLEAARPGVKALREFLTLARDGYDGESGRSGAAVTGALEESVAEAIGALGYATRPQVGMAGFFVDIGVLDPGDPDRYLLDVEFDGPGYHAARWVRDRDRLRREILQARGWRMHRIWAADWFYRREQELERLKAAIEAALAGAPASEPEPETGDETPDETPAHEPASSSQIEPAPAPPGKLRPYEKAGFDLGFKAKDILRQSDAKLADAMARIVALEQPICSELAKSRFKSLCGQNPQLAYHEMDRRASRALDLAIKGKLIRNDGHRFVRLAEDPAPTPRDRSALKPSDPLRRAENHAPSELAAAAVIALQQNLALDRKALAAATARLLGHRAHPHITTAIDHAILQGLKGKLEADHLGRLRLR